MSGDVRVPKLLWERLRMAVFTYAVLEPAQWGSIGKAIGNLEASGDIRLLSDPCLRPCVGYQAAMVALRVSAGWCRELARGQADESGKRGVR